MIGFVLLLLLPTLTIWSSLNRKQKTVISGVRIKLKRSDSSDSYSIALMTPLTTPIFDSHKIISALYDPGSVISENYLLQMGGLHLWHQRTNNFFPKNLVSMILVLKITLFFMKKETRVIVRTLVLNM